MFAIIIKFADLKKITLIEFLPFTIHILPLALLLVTLLICSALISGSETAFFSLLPSQLNTLRIDNTRKSHAVLKLLDDQDSLLSTLLIINNLINISAILVANSLIDKVIVFGEIGATEFIVKVVIVTFLLLLFGEIMPKIFAAYNNYSFARLMALPLLSLRTITKPLSYLLIKSGKLITNSLSTGHNVSMDELQNAIEITQTETPEDKKMLSGIVRFVGTEVDEIMKPRIDVIALDIEASYDEVRKTVTDNGFSRIPVYKESFDQIQGILYVKDLLPYLYESDDFEWQKLLRKPYYVPEHKKINDLLEEFQTRKIHLAIVVDEYGGTLGIVTLEDILEEIVGEIADESDDIENFYHRIDESNYMFDGKTHIGDFERILALADGYLDTIKRDADTLAGLMLELKGDFFKVNDSVEYENLKLTATETDNYRITKVHVTIKSVVE